ncbi:MAG: glycoside hydrolase family 28 protein [Clostridia bacterium]|nr:glycoside hydrolase family 28 protein [Clostridia bacterium]
MNFFTPFEMPTGASIPERSVCITDFGGVPGGREKNTLAFQSAIAHLSALGGGRLNVPEGLWLTGPIHLQSGVELHVEKGAEVRFTADREDYLPPVFTMFEGVRCFTYSAPIYARYCHDIAVTGEGRFNGQGFCWWYTAVDRAGVEALYKAGEDGLPVEQRVYASDALCLRPNLLHFVDCENVTIQGAEFTFSPFWTVHPTWCRNLIVRDISVYNPWVHAPNTDGCNLEGCSRALIDGIQVDTGDDAVCLKSGRDFDGRRVNIPCENVVVRRVKAKRSHGGVTIGSEMSGGVKNILVEDCEFQNSLIGLWIKTAPERGGAVENIEYRNIRALKLREYALCITMGYYVDGNLPADAPFMPRIRHIGIDGLSCEKAGTGLYIHGMQSSPIEDVHIENADVCGSTNMDVRDVNGLFLKNTVFR